MGAQTLRIMLTVKTFTQMKKILVAVAMMIRMRKKIFCALLPLMMLSVRPAEAQACETNGAVADSVNIDLKAISDVDLFIHEKPSSELMSRLLDVYNASVVMNSIMTDFDLLMRVESLNEDVAKAIGNMDVDCVHDPETLSKLKEYKAEMLYLTSVNSSDVDQDVHNPWTSYSNLNAYLLEKYHISTFGEMDQDKWYDATRECAGVPEWSELVERRGEKGMVKKLRSKFDKATDFDARCIYAIELAHAWMAECEGFFYSNESDILSVMESLMKEKRYSMYLYELWLTWRVLYQDTKGMSTYSEIPNEIYNKYRRSCVMGILSHIEKHPDDVFAINTCLAMSASENILRFGNYSYGNQSAIEKLRLFGELFDN